MGSNRPSAVEAAASRLNPIRGAWHKRLYSLAEWCYTVAVHRIFACLSVAIFFAATVRAEMPERSYWVWHRAQPLSADERTELAGQNVHTLYWNVGELDLHRGSWRWKNAPLAIDAVAPGFHVVPVVRLTSEEKVPFAPAAMPALTAALQLAARAGTLQIDFDCPDRLLGDYAAALEGWRRSIPHLTITALTHWPRLAAFPALTHSVEEMAPMFYDMQGDPTGVSADAPPPPILDLGQVIEALKLWHECPIPWRSGLPTFARLTVFDRTGLSRGQIPNWSWDDFCFHKNLRTLGSTRLGVTLFRADDDVSVARTPVSKDEIVASRFVDRASLATVLEESRKAGAAGAIFFRLADGTDPAGWSAADLRQLDVASAPRLVLRAAANERLELINDSDFDLPTRLSGEKGDRDRGYALEIDAPGPLFREALAGDFWRVTSHVKPDADKPTPVAVPLATRVTYWFSHLPARARLQTGLLQLAPGATLGQIRYRILNCEGATAWKPVQPPDNRPAAP